MNKQSPLIYSTRKWPDKHRNRVDLMRAVLDAFEGQPLGITRIMRASNLPHNRAMPLCHELVHKGILEYTEVYRGSTLAKNFSITEKGYKVKNVLKELFGEVEVLVH